MTEEELVAAFPCETRVIEYNGKLVAVVGFERPKHAWDFSCELPTCFFSMASGLWVSIGATKWPPLHDMTGWSGALEEASRQLVSDS